MPKVIKVRSEKARLYGHIVPIYILRGSNTPRPGWGLFGSIGSRGDWTLTLLNRD